jgi:hypothetical protein
MRARLRTGLAFFFVCFLVYVFCVASDIPSQRASLHPDVVPTPAEQYAALELARQEEQAVLVPAGDATRPESGSNLLTFSFYGGSNPRYTDGAIANAKLYKSVYPGWGMRVYHDDSVPKKLLDQLRAEG